MWSALRRLCASVCAQACRQARAVLLSKANCCVWYCAVQLSAKLRVNGSPGELIPTTDTSKFALLACTPQRHSDQRQHKASPLASAPLTRAAPLSTSIRLRTGACFRQEGVTFQCRGGRAIHLTRAKPSRVPHRGCCSRSLPWPCSEPRRPPTGKHRLSGFTDSYLHTCIRALARTALVLPRLQCICASLEFWGGRVCSQ